MSVTEFSSAASGAVPEKSWIYITNIVPVKGDPIDALIDEDGSSLFLVQYLNVRDGEVCGGVNYGLYHGYAWNVGGKRVQGSPAIGKMHESRVRSIEAAQATRDFPIALDGIVSFIEEARRTITEPPPRFIPAIEGESFKSFAERFLLRLHARVDFIKVVEARLETTRPDLKPKPRLCARIPPAPRLYRRAIGG